MKKILQLIVAVLSSTYLNAQDTLVFKNNNVEVVKLIELRPDEVKYKQFDNIEGPDFVVKKSELSQIKYANGKTENFVPVENNSSAQVSNFGQAEATFAKGQSDAMKYYRGYKPAGTSTIVTTLIFLPAGLIPAIACGSTPPKDKNLGYPNSELFNNPDYRNGYREKARRIKSNKVWTNFGIGVGVSFAAFLLLSSTGN